MGRRFKLILVVCVIISGLFGSLVFMLPQNSLASTLPGRPQNLHVYAGEDFMAATGSPVTMSADVRIGSLPCRPEVSIEWSVISGDKRLVSFNDATTINTVVTFTNPGTFSLRLSASYQDDFAYDDVNVKVYSVRPAPEPGNDAPIVDIGENDKIYVPSYPGNYHFRNAFVSDDGFPVDPGLVTVLWEAERYPAGAVASFNDRNIINTTATFSALGLYSLKVTAFDGEKISFDYVEVEVYYVRPPLDPQNEAPIVDIGENDTIEISSDPGYYYFVNASVTDDGLPAPPSALSIEWSVITYPSGGSVDFVTSPGEINTEVVFDKIGRYVLKLSAYDGEKTSFDTVAVNVIKVRPAPGPGNSAPYVDIGEESRIIIASDPGIYKFVNAWVIDDGNPNPPGELDTNWSLVESNNGGKVLFLEGEDEVNVTAKFDKPDTYSLRLTVFDGEKSYYDEVTVKVIYVRPAPGATEITYEALEIENTRIVIDSMISAVKTLMTRFF